MSRSIESWLDTAMARGPAMAYFRRRTRSKLTVLAYHAISDAGRFAMQLDSIALKARPVGLDDVFDAISGKRPLPPSAMLITFDDVDKSLVSNGLPLLRQHGFPAVAFVVPGLIGSDRPLWPREARELIAKGATASRLRGLTPDDAVRVMKRLPDEMRRAALDELRATAREPAGPVSQLAPDDLTDLVSSGIEIGNHTLTHPCLDRCSDERIEEEVHQAHRVIGDLTGCSPRAFAYPNGDVDGRVSRVVSQAGYGAAFLFDHRLNTLPIADSLAISRVRVNSTDDLDRFEAVTNGLHPVMLALRSRRRGRSADDLVRRRAPERRP